MLPTFVIGLREGLEAALIVGIIAAFLRKQGRRDLLRWVLAGVAVAVLLCLGIGVALDAYSHNLPQRQQEGLETVIGGLAVGMVTYMVVWMRRNSRNLKGQLEGLAADALAGTSGAGRAMVLMAFLAVIREGLETVVFLLAAFNEASNPSSAGFGVVLGILVAMGLGYGIYRGGVRINLSKFFRATGLVLVLVAAGIVVNALHTAHEAGWLEAGQGSTVDLSWLVQGGSVQASLLTGMLGIQSHPVVAEVVGWLLYLVPVGLYVAWPPGRPVPVRLAVRTGAGAAVLAGAAAIVLASVAPSAPTQRPVTSGAGLSAQVLARTGQTALVRTQTMGVVAGAPAGTKAIRLVSSGVASHAGVSAEQYATTLHPAAASGQPKQPKQPTQPAQPAQLANSRVAELNGGRLPLGVRAGANGSLPAAYRDAVTVTAWLDGRTDRVLDLRLREQITVTVRTPDGPTELSRPIAVRTQQLPAPARTAAVTAAQHAHARLDRRSLLHTLAGWCVALAAIAMLVVLGFLLAGRRRAGSAATSAEPVGSLVRS